MNTKHRVLLDAEFFSDQQLLSERRLRDMAFRKRGKECELDDLPDTCELNMDDRRELDDAVLEMIGASTKKERLRLLDQLYHYLAEFFESVRRKEEQAIENKNKSKRRATVRPIDLANQIYEEIAANQPALLRQYDPDFLDRSKPFDTYELPAEGRPEATKHMFMPHGVQFIKGKKKTVAELPTSTPTQGKLICLIAESGTRGLVRVPCDPAEISRLSAQYGDFLQRRDRQIRLMIEQRTIDEDLQDKVHEALFTMLQK